MLFKENQSLLDENQKDFGGPLVCLPVVFNQSQKDPYLGRESFQGFGMNEKECPSVAARLAARDEQSQQTIK